MMNSTTASDSASSPDFFFSSFPSRLGTFWVAYFDDIVCRAELGGSAEKFARTCGESLGVITAYRKAPPAQLHTAIVRCLEQGERYSGQVDMSRLSPFQQRVLHKTMEIPCGEVRTYGWVACEIGAPRAVRATGTALGKNPVPILIPCHRVVQADYRLGQYGMGGTEQKRALLTSEGVDVDFLEDLAHRGVRYLENRAERTYCVPSCHSLLTGVSVVRPFHDSEQARQEGLRPCPLCRPTSLQFSLP